MSTTLSMPVSWFIGDVGAAVAAIGGRAHVDPAHLRGDVALEACNLACGFIDANGRSTDDELWALTEAFGPELDTPLAGATPDDIRRAGLIAQKDEFLAKPSALFELLLAADARNGTAYSHVYYRNAVELAFAVAAIDMHTSTTEIDIIERFRGMLLSAMAGAGVRRPGQPAPASATSPKPSPTPAAATAPTAPEAEDGELPPPQPLEELLAELDGLVGLEAVKREVRRTADLTRIEQLRRDRKLPVLDHSRHLVFTGNPGTGKTTVARLLARIYRTLGVVEKGHLVETDRSQLVAGFVGQTAPLVRKKFDEADEGMLLIDEAYALIRGGENDFGKEAIDTIVKLVEDRRDSIIVVVAGYPEEMVTFVDANPGLRSRFPKTIHFPDYTTDELVRIFDGIGSKQQYKCNEEATTKVRAWLDSQPRIKGFGNGRLARNLFEAAVSRQASRLAAMKSPTDEDLTTLTPADIPELGESL